MSDPIKSEFTQFQELAREIKDLGEDAPPAVQVFAAAVAAAEEKMAALHQTKRNKLAPVLTAKDRSDLLALHTKIGQAAEIVLKSGVEEDLANKTRKLTAIAARNYRTIKAFNPAKAEKSLPELLEDARAVTLNTEGLEMEEGMRGKQSERMPLSYLNDKGKKITGVFTAKKTVNYLDTVEKILQEEADDPANRMSPQAKQMMRDFLKKALPVANKIGLQNRGAAIPLGQTKEEKLTTLFWGLSFGNKLHPEYLENAFCKLYPKLQGQDLSRVFGKGTMQRLCRKLEPVSMFTGINVDSARIMNGSRLDTRNAAMYGIADLLGAPHLIAKAVPMKLVGPNGEVTEGTFMYKAKGMDLNNLPPSALDIRENALNGTDGKGYKDLADMQVLDFICGNVDRHGGNLFYQFRNGKFCGVQGIDNETALGCTLPNGTRNINRLVVPKNMKVISRSMFDKVMTLTPEELGFAMRGYGLSEQEIKSAKYRLNKLQEELKKGTIRVMEDEEFKNINARNLKQLCAQDPQTGAPQNLFAIASKNIRTLPTQRLAQQKAYRDLEDMTAIGEDNRALPGSQDREIEYTDLLLREMDRVTNRGFWHFHKGTSQEFEEMREAVRNYKEYQLRIRDKIRDAQSEGRKNDPDAPIDTVVTEQELKKMTELSRTAREKADIYLGKKAGSKFNSYTNARKSIARFVKSFGETRENVTETERQTQEKQMNAAVTKSKRMIEKKNQGAAGPQLNL